MGLRIGTCTASTPNFPEVPTGPHCPKSIPPVKTPLHQVSGTRKGVRELRACASYTHVSRALPMSLCPKFYHHHFDVLKTTQQYMRPVPLMYITENYSQISFRFNILPWARLHNAHASNACTPELRPPDARGRRLHFFRDARRPFGRGLIFGACRLPRLDQMEWLRKPHVAAMSFHRYSQREVWLSHLWHYRWRDTRMYLTNRRARQCKCNWNSNPES